MDARWIRELQGNEEGIETMRRASKGQGGLQKDADDNEGFDNEGETQKDQERLRR